jgi:Zn-dependent M28 family amino/carboxypeptidase
VLVNGHFDTTLGSPGAADCASCVGIMLEIVRALTHATRLPAAPIVFLFNGGEETFMQAAHGFVAHHPWAPSVGKP